MKYAPLLEVPVPQEVFQWFCPLCGANLQIEGQHHQCSRDNHHLAKQVKCEICEGYFMPGPNGEGCPGCAQST